MEATISTQSNDCQPYYVLFEDPSTHPLSIGIFAPVYITIFLLGNIGNIAVIVVTLRRKTLQTVQNLFLINMALGNLILCLLSIPLTPVTHMYKEWLFGEVMCRLMVGIQAVGVFISSFSLCSIAVDRYLRLASERKISVSQRTAFIIISVMWALSLIFTIPYVLHIRMVNYPEMNICGEFCTEEWPNDNAKRAYTLLVLLVQAIIPFSIIVYCYHCLFSALRERVLHKMTTITHQVNMLCLMTASASMTSQNNHLLIHIPSSEPHSPLINPTVEHSEGQFTHLLEQKQKVIKERRRVTFILASMVVLFVLTTLPHNIVSLLMEFDSVLADETAEGSIFRTSEGTDLTYLLNLLAHCVSMISCIANPFLYAFLNTEFKDVIVEGLSKISSRRSSRMPPATPSPMPGATISFRFEPDTEQFQLHSPRAPFLAVPDERHF
ncbi:7 transmembrane receptor (rhodopsin family) domain-containing protein [Ditylenchus destructor]|uniref:7 transmembrane receptor (Rhodopsin family) domain-containing protein n=1 Tax=Ditylenchus destructor TaxID=166010 RepID=A0AAD4RAZ1_9BILA|nr:7 transmembrane receptor (rhodopsin family) domain-containing protein [Ditylenchus destructor]